MLIKTAEDFNKNYTLSFENDESRDDWITAIAAAKENKPIPDSVNRAFVMKNEDDLVEDSKTYFNRMLTAFNETFRDDCFQDVMLRLSSFFTRVAFTVRQERECNVSPGELLESCEKVRKMSSVIRQDMQRSNLMTQEIDHLFNDLNASIDYCMKNAQQYVLEREFISRKQLRVTQYSGSESVSSIATESSEPSKATPLAEETQSRGIVQHGFQQRYVTKRKWNDS